MAQAAAQKKHPVWDTSLLTASAHSPEVDQIESGGKLRDETSGFNFGTRGKMWEKNSDPKLPKSQFWDASDVGNTHVHVLTRR